ncbi:kinetochore-associated Ndc80 complex subunit spc25 [Coemansia aciculifera]|nr:kinetochore-associated Ndc80 complex subunit spc25 [Coemansia aciculifera]
MNTPNFQGFSTPRRRPLTPGRRDHILPLFTSPASAKITRLFSTHPSSAGTLAEVAEEGGGGEAAPIAVDYDAPRVWFQRDEDKRQNTEFTRRVDEMVAELRRLIRERRSEHEQQVGEAREREQRMSRDMEALEAENRGVLAALKDELGAEDRLSSDVRRLDAQLKEAREKGAALVKKRDGVQRAVEVKQAAVDEKRGVLEGQQKGNEGELAFFGDRMGLRIVGGGEADRLSFVFTLISLSEPQKPYAVTVDLSQREYRATSCKPLVGELDDHVEWLNSSRDFFGFLKRMRHSFVNHYFNESTLH